MRALRVRARLAHLALAVGVMITGSTVSLPGHAATGQTVVSAEVPTATTLVTTGCPPLDATRTSLGALMAGSQAVTTADCDVLFGSSNAPATLRTYQPDGRGTAMSTSVTTMTGTGSSNRMLDVDMATASIGWAVSDGTAAARLWKTIDGGVTWTAVSDANDGLDGSGEGIDAVSTTVAWVNRSNSNELAYTIDGTTWTKVTMTAHPSALVNRVVAASSSTAWALGSQVVSGRARARIWRTTDTGATWNLVWSDNTVDSEAHEGVALSTTSMYAATTAGAAGNGLVKTTDGSAFTSIAPATSGYYDIDSYDGVHLAAATSSGQIHVSANAGGAWSTYSPPVDMSMRGIDYDAGGTILAVTSDGFMVSSPDDGATWNVVDQDLLGGRYFSLDAVGSTIVATLNSGAIVRSGDAGVTWSLNAGATITNWSGVDGIDGGRLWRVGGPGHVQTSTDGGVTWAAQTSNATKALHSVVALSRTVAVIVGADGTIRRTADSGTTWSMISSPTVATLRTVVSAPSPSQSTLWAGGDGGVLLRSTDAGLTWSIIASPTTDPITGIGPWSAQDLMIGTAGGTSRVWTTTDAGATWTARAAGTIDGVGDVVVVPGTDIGMVFDDAQVRRTTDRGATWAAIPGTRWVLGADLAPDETTIWATGEFGSTFSSPDRGLTWQEWTGGSTSKSGFDVAALSPHSAVSVFDGSGTKTTDEPNGVSDYDGGTASWTGTGFFGICLRAAPATGSTWPTTGSCPQSNGTNWRALPLHGGLAASSVASTLAAGTTTASFRFGMKVPTTLAPGTYVAPVAFEVIAPAG